MGGRRGPRLSSRARRRRRLLAALAGFSAASFLAAATAAPPGPEDTPDAASQPVPTLDTIAVTARRLDAPREDVEPRIRAPTYAIPHPPIPPHPPAPNHPPRQTLLQP